MRFIRPIILPLCLLLSLLLFAPAVATHAASDTTLFDTRLADTWPWEVRRWEPQIQTVSLRYGIDPNLIAAIILAESAGNDQSVSYVGAVGLMGVMPHGPEFPYRPTSEELVDVDTNVNVGTAILADILRQSGGDIHAAVAAYNGGWALVNHDVPRGYAEKVLDLYGRAVASRIGMSTDFATRWTVVVEIRNGHIPVEALLTGFHDVGDTPLYGEHLIYRGTDFVGRSYYIKGYAAALEYVAIPEKYEWLTASQ